MKKVNILLFVFLIIVVLTSTTYFTFFYGKDNYDFTEYKEVFDELKNKENFDTPADFDISFGKDKKDDYYLVSITIDNAKRVFNDVKLLAIDNSKDENKNYPQINLYTKDKLTLVTDTPNGKNQTKGINISIKSKTEIKTVYIYFSYDDDGTRIENFYEVKIDA